MEQSQLLKEFLNVYKEKYDFIPYLQSVKDNLRMSTKQNT